MLLLKLFIALLFAIMILAGWSGFNGSNTRDFALSDNGERVSPMPSSQRSRIEFDDKVTALFRKSIMRLRLLRQTNQQLEGPALGRSLPRLRQQMRAVISSSQDDARLLRNSRGGSGDQKRLLQQLLQAETRLASSTLDYLIALERSVGEEERQRHERQMTLNLALYEEACAAVLNYYRTQMHPELAVDS